MHDMSIPDKLPTDLAEGVEPPDETPDRTPGPAKLALGFLLVPAAAVAYDWIGATLDWPWQAVKWAVVFVGLAGATILSRRWPRAGYVVSVVGFLGVGLAWRMLTG